MTKRRAFKRIVLSLALLAVLAAATYAALHVSKAAATTIARLLV